MTALIIVVIVGFSYQSWRRKWIISKAFPADWLAIIERRLAFFGKLQTGEQEQLKKLVQLFLADKKFYGCNGLIINDDIRVTIAAEACLLLLNRPTTGYASLKHILVYPDAFQAGHEKHNEDGTVSLQQQGLLGESWQHGKIILSWDDVTFGAANIHDGHNVSLHEFAHQLDSETGSTNGAPILGKNACQSWAQVLTKEFAELNKAFEEQHKSVMDFYGTSNPAEFFAVATETFFEKPGQLAERHPELFNELHNFYKVDPRRWQ